MAQVRTLFTIATLTNRQNMRKQTYQAVVYLILTDLSVLCSHNYIIYPEGPPSVRGSMVIPRMRSACDPIHELCLRWPFPLGAIFHNSYTRNYYLSHLSSTSLLHLTL